MSVREAVITLRRARRNFKDHIEDYGYGREELANVIGTSPQYLSSLLNGNENGKAAKEKLRILFKYTGYTGENWLQV
ncbi:XRE family transcriptional regulator [Weissella koreensis]|uniref:XRE family transcriptional regulator n=1 Tax=Weissella koreensis TaxID=165096 RepID=UPI0022BA7009|nr:XRE family transcriptional regulator [Weissella koreensis]MCZ9310649.1 XRE family transcriptional regulator [Weissella koreensis]